MKVKLLKKGFLLATGLLVGASASWAQSWTTVQTLDFETEGTYNSGWSWADASRKGSPDWYTLSASSHALIIRAGSSYTQDYYYTFTNTDFTSAEEWKMELDVAFTSANSAANQFFVYSAASGSSWGCFNTTTKLFSLQNASYSTDVNVYTGADETTAVTTLSSAATGYAKGGGADPTTFLHLIITASKDDEYVKLAVEDASGNSLLAATKVSDFANPAGMSLRNGKGIGKVAIDNVSFSIVSNTVLAPSAALTAVNGTSRTITMSQAQGADIYYYECEDDNYDTTGLSATQYTAPISISATKYYAIYASSGGKSSSIVNYTFEAGTAVPLAAPSVSLTAVTNNYDSYLTSPTFTIYAPNNAGVLLVPSTETLSYTFTPEGGSESDATVISSGDTYTPTEKGTLTVYAATTGYATSSYSIPVSDYYSIAYATDYTTYTENPFGDYSDVTSSWWTTAYRSTASGNTTLGRVRFGNNTVSDLVIGYGLGRAGSNWASNKVRYATKGNIEVLLINQTNKSGVSSGTYYTNILETAGSGAQTDLSADFSVPSYNTLKAHTCYTPDSYPSSVTATPGLNGYATFASPYNLDLSSLGDAKAYTATLDGTTLSFNPCTAKVPAGTGLLIQADAAVEIPVSTEAATAVDGNALTGVIAATDLQSNAEGNYIFVMKKATDATDELTFAPLSTTKAVTVPAGKAYVSVPATAFGSATRALNISFGGETTGINNVEAASMLNEGVYNLNGQRVAQPQTGLYIVNGKKVIIK